MNFFKNRKTNWHYILILFVLVFLFCGGILAYRYYRYLWVPREESKSPEVEGPKEISEKEDETAPWRLYRNEEFGFEIKYPEDWKFQEYSPATYFFPKVYDRGIYTPISLKLQVKNLKKPYQPEARVEEYYIKDRKFYRGSLFPHEITYILPQEDNSKKIAEAVLSIKIGVTTHTQFIKNRSNYPLSDEEIKKLCEQMLSTFKFIREIKKERREIKIKKEIQLTKSEQDEAFPSFSPDGKEIVFWREGNIWIMNSDGSNPKMLTNFKKNGGGIHPQEMAPTLSFSSDGQKIVFSKEGQIWMMDKDGSNLEQLTKDKISIKYSPSLSPDNSKIVYAANFADKPSGINIWVMDSDGTNQKRLTRYEDNVHPSFTPDGKRIIYSSCIAGNKDIWIMNTDGTNKIRLTNGETDEYFPFFSPDMEKIVFTQGILISSHVEYVDLWMMDRDGSNKIRLTEDEAFDISPSFSPDGKKVIFSSDRAGNYDIWLMELEY